MRLIGETWQALWRNNRGGGLLTLAFWYTLVTSLYQYLAASRLGPLIPKSLTQAVAHPGTVVALAHLPTGLWVKIALVYLTFLLIVVPFTVGGLYGGIAAALRDKSLHMRYFAFFRFGYLNFWRALAQIVLAFLYSALVFALILGIIWLASVVGGSAVGVAGLIAVVGLLLWLVGTLLYWFGRTFMTEESPSRGWKVAIRWGVGRLGWLIGNMVVLIVMLFAVVLAVLLIAHAVPGLGAILLVLVVGMIAPAFIGTYAMELYQRFAD